MKLLGFIEVFDYVNSNCLSRSKHSTITIGNFKDASVLLLQTPSNKSGTRYEIENNILRVFQRFLKDGKATIRLKVPSHELRLVNEPIQLKSFLTVLRSCFKEPGSILPTLAAKPKFTKAPPKKAVINSTDHLEQLDKLSLKLTELQIKNVPIKELPTAVTRLKALSTLEVSDTFLITFPKGLATFPVLTSLILSNNCLKLGKYWDFLDSCYIQEQLKTLDLSHNELRILPPRISALQQLTVLRLNNNSLLWLPHTIANMKALRHVSVAHNAIISFPSSVFRMQNVSIDVSFNPHRFPTDRRLGLPYKTVMPTEEDITAAHFTNMMSLKEIASRTIVNKRVPYRKVGLPTCLVQHLNEAKACQQCKKSCFTHFFIVFGCSQTKGLSHEVTYTGTNITTHFFVCSRECMMLSYPKLSWHSRESISYIAYSM